MIDNPPGHIWVRGIPTTDIVIKKLFSKVVIVATGSSIGPALGVPPRYAIPSAVRGAERLRRR